MKSFASLFEGLFQIVKNCLDGAEAIINKILRDPKTYIKPDLSTWGKKYIYSRFFGFTGESQGLLDKLDEDCLRALGEKFPGLCAPEYTRESFYREATGAAEGAEAALNQAKSMRAYFTQARIQEQINNYRDYEELGDFAKCLGIYMDWIRYALLDASTLFNTLDKKTQQGDKPKPVPGPDEELVETPFGWIIRKKQSRPVGSIPEGEFWAEFDRRSKALRS